MCLYIIFSDLKALFPLVYLFVSKSCIQTKFGQTYDNRQNGPDRIYEKWGVIKVGTNDRYQNWHRTVI